MLERIYASKMFRSSKNKDHIRAAVSNPVNAELVKQLSSYLDLPEKDDENENKVTEDVKEVNTKDTSEETSEEVNVDVKPEHKISDHLSEPMPAERVDDKNRENSETESTEENTSNEETQEEKKTQEEDSDVAETTSVSGQSIQASECIECEKAKDLSIVKDALNTREDTQGVTRTNVNNNELWIYFDDKKNLNDIMTNVIDYFIAAGYSYLEFNRLARSDNAMVFLIKQ